MAAQDAERRRLARELHDDVGSMLTTLGIGLRALQEARDIETVHRQAKELQQLAQSVLDSTRSLSRGLHPSVLDDLGFETAVRAYAGRFGSLHQIAVDVEILGLEAESFDGSTGWELFRVLQESLTNSVRHGGARRIAVVIRRRSDSIRMVIEDDGQGMAYDPSTEDGEGMGLVSMRERVTLLGGTCVIETTLGGGFAVIVTVPIAEASSVE